jgi:hypothetical protein
MIVKIQRPISTNEPVPLALIYNKDRSIQFTVPFSQVAGWFDSPATLANAKIYCDANTANGHLQINRRVRNRNW